MIRLMGRCDRRLLNTSVAGIVLVTLASPVIAQTVPVETIIINGKRDNTVADVAPSITPLDALQPTSVVNKDFIEKNMPLAANYDEAIKFTPSVFDTAPNGPGLAESQNISIRGFQDGQFNVTFDGIPFQDANDFTHHTTSYFMAHDLGLISVDRGPGTAATIGNATFGGTVALLSKAPDEQSTVNTYGSYGSWHTLNFGTEYDSGTLRGGTRFLIDAEGVSSNGYLTNLRQRRQNVYGKLVQPLGPNATLTLVSMYNHVRQNISLGATQAEIDQFGPNYGLSNDPTNQNYYQYNADFIKTDFSYADLAARFGEGWSFDAKLYTYGYFHKGLNGEDPNGEFPNGTTLDPVAANAGITQYPNDVPGQLLTNNYRSVGTIVRVTKDFSFGDFKAGLWYDHQINTRRLLEVDMSQNMALNYDLDTGSNTDSVTGLPNATDRDLHQTLQTFQPYGQIDLNPVQGLTISGGLRYSYFDRNVSALVNVKTGLPQAYDNKFHSWLPSFDVNYRISPRWSLYGQVAKGFLAPNENFFDRNTPNTTSLKPQVSWNYQVGTAVNSRRFALSFDAYIIDFSNLITGVARGGQTVFENLGGVTYRGLEAEGTYRLGHGLSVYANGSLNSAKVQGDGGWVPNTPKSTAAAGLVYDRDGLSVSLLGKWIGPRFGDSGDSQYLSSYATADFSIGYDLAKLIPQVRSAELRLKVNNITNSTKIINLAGYTVQDSTPLYWTQPGRSAFLSLSVKY